MIFFLILYIFNCSTVNILPPLWPSGVVPGYRSKDAGFDSQRYHFILEILGLELGPLSLVRISEEILEWKSCGTSLENRD
jgi:hypothetical protein